MQDSLNYEPSKPIKNLQRAFKKIEPRSEQVSAAERTKYVLSPTVNQRHEIS